ncbi:MAG: transcriptional repressor LexA [Patescibacteria group bacterium]
MITKRQKEVLLAIYVSFKESGFPPTLQDLKDALEVNSNQAVLDLLKTLEKKNLIKREEGSARGIVILPLGYDAINKDPLVRVVGKTAAGPVVEAIEQHEWTEMPNGYQKCDNVFIVKVAGNSMIEAGIYDGDSILIKKADEYKNGDIVLARQGDDVTIKRFVYDNGRTYLKPENPACKIIAITHDTFFIGKMMTNLGK